MQRGYLILVDTIFRLTNPGDTEASVGATEKIIFNAGSVPDSTGKMITTSFRMVSDLNPHPNPDTQLNQIQDSLLGVVEVTVAGYFVDHNNTLGPRNLYNWSVDEDVNDDFRKGRFGLTLSTMDGIDVWSVGLPLEKPLKLISSAFVGLVVNAISKKSPAPPAATLEPPLSITWINPS